MRRHGLLVLLLRRTPLRKQPGCINFFKSGILALAAMIAAFGPQPNVAMAAATDKVRTVALSGMPAPGTDELFGDIGYSGVSLNNHGETAFIASPTYNNYEFVFSPQPTTPVNDESVWTEAGGGGLRRITREGPGMPGDGTFDHVARPLISDTGETLYHASRVGDGQATPHHPRNLFRNQLGQADTAVAGRGSAAPSTGDVFSSIYAPSVNADGKTAFYGVLRNANLTSAFGIWAELGGGPLDLVARTGDIAPGTGGTFRELSEKPAIGLAGHVAFGGTVVDNDLDGANNEAMWIASPTGDLKVVVRGRDAVPGTDNRFRLLDDPSVNRNGDLAFSTGLFTSPHSGNEHGNAIIRYDAEEGLATVALAGERPPGVDAMFSSNRAGFSTFFDPIIGDEGHISFRANLLENNELTGSIWLADPSGVLEMVAREGDPAPGTTDSFSTLDNPTVNARGQVAFSSRTVDFTNDHYGIWAQDQRGDLRLVARAGDRLDVSDDPAAPDLRTIARLSFRHAGSFGGEKVTGFNDRGQVAFFARFTDGTSGVFVSSVVAIPEPSAVVLTFGLLGMGTALRRTL